MSLTVTTAISRIQWINSAFNTLAEGEGAPGTTMPYSVNNGFCRYVVLDEQAKKTLLRKIPHGLYICGVKDGEEMNGFTASWVMQASFTPPLVVNCVKHDSISHTMIKASGTFALSFLEAGQKDLAQNFFKPLRRVGNKFAEVEFYPAPETGCPVIKDSLGYLECRLVGTVEHGDHTVFVGEVLGAGLHREGDPLLLESTGWNYGG